jgi:poly(3-hydroxybutyrate) depolymerase
MRRVSYFTGAVSMALFVLLACSSSDDDAGMASSSSGSSGDRPDGSSSGSSGSPDSSADASSSGDTGTTPPEVFVTRTNETMSFAGKTRSYILAKPTNYDGAKSYPLVLSFHGNPGTAEGMAQGLPFDSVSKRDAVIAYPQANTTDWDLYTETGSNADMSFIEALFDEIATKANIDRSKVLGYGYSGGGFFLTQFTCRFGGLFKAISINAGGGPNEEEIGGDQYGNGCWMCPGGPIATIVTHGAADGNVLPGSGEFTHDCYATYNGCDETLSASAPSPCQTHDNCPADKPVKWCLIPGQSHAPWVDSMKEAWAFFNGLP